MVGRIGLEPQNAPEERFESEALRPKADRVAAAFNAYRRAELEKRMVGRIGLEPMTSTVSR